MKQGSLKNLSKVRRNRAARRENVEQWMMERPAGFTVHDLAKKLGTHYRTAQRWISEYERAGKVEIVGCEPHNRMIWMWKAKARRDAQVAGGGSTSRAASG